MLYTYEQFAEHYGRTRGTSYWWEAQLGPALIARQAPPPPQAPVAPGQQPTEVRRKARDDAYYTWDQFVQ
eukprot:12917769-Alexandrium_andersonii.AAC.1